MAFALDTAQKRRLERASAEVEQAAKALADAQRKRKALVVSVLADVGDQRGALATVARAAGLTPEAARQWREGRDR